MSDVPVLTKRRLGFDPRLRLERAQTIMGGASCCTFRYRLASPE